MEALLLILYFIALFMHLFYAKKSKDVGFALIGFVPILNMVIFYFALKRWIRS